MQSFKSLEGLLFRCQPFLHLRKLSFQSYFDLFLVIIISFKSIFINFPKIIFFLPVDCHIQPLLCNIICNIDCLYCSVYLKTCSSRQYRLGCPKKSKISLRAPILLIWLSLYIKIPHAKFQEFRGLFVQVPAIFTFEKIVILQLF